MYFLIGKKLGHSYSVPIHRAFGNTEYSLCELAPEEVDRFMKQRKFKGINVTIPYKETVIPYLDEVSDRAKRIGSVNTIVNHNGKLYGYNTDYYGFSYMARAAGITFADKKVIIFGSGGTSLTAQAVVADEGASDIVVISRNGKNNYSNLHLHYDADIVINCTPVGMYPDTDSVLVDLEPFSKLVGVIDVIYNPSKTNILIEAKKRGIAYTNGLSMLVAQAKRAHELFFETKVEENEIGRICRCLELDKVNIVLVGMPGSGKTTISKILANKLGRNIIDTDEMIIRKDGRSIPNIFSSEGEGFFRELESQCVKEACFAEKSIIATGGGAVLNEVNRKNIMRNSIVIWLNCPVDRLAREGRPLSSEDNDRMNMMLEQRHPLYNEVSDIKVYTDIDASITANKILNILLNN